MMIARISCDKTPYALPTGDHKGSNLRAFFGARKSWRCFFCDEVFWSRRKAWEHFGEEGCTSDPPACVDPLRRDEKMRLNELREARDYALRLQRELESSENEAARASQMEIELKRYFGVDCTSVWTAGDRYISALNRLGDLETAVVKP